MKALIVIDIQNGLTMKKNLYNDTIFINTVNLAISKFRKSENMVIFVQHNNKILSKGSFDWQLDDRLNFKMEDQVFQKEHGNTFTNIELVNLLKENNIKEIVMAGLVTHGCIRYSCLGGIKEGFKVSILKNGHTSWNIDAKEQIECLELELAELNVSVLEV